MSKRTKQRASDPVERVIENALAEAGIGYRKHVVAANGREIDFYVPVFDTFIEVKRFSTERTAAQIEGIGSIIVVQGMQAAEALAALINSNRTIGED